MKEKRSRAVNIRELETPCYIIREENYEENIRLFCLEFGKRWRGTVEYGYSVKTNNFPWLLKRARARGFLAEVVSPDEWDFALRCGYEPEQIVFNGPQKRDNAAEALSSGALVNLDSLEEVEKVCVKLRETKGAFRVGLRVNFDLEKECPGETTCRGIPGRFGICVENGDFGKAIEMLRKSGIALYALHMHQSSSSRSLRIFETLSAKANEIGKEYDLGKLPVIDIGGGFFGGDYFPEKPKTAEYAETVCETLSEFYDPSVTTLLLEPGAAILATAMDYLTSVLNIREIRGSRIVTVDGSLLHINPMMHPHPTPFTMIDPGEETDREQIIGGSTCMELDRFWPRDLCCLAAHDSKFLFHCCGAYMSVHNSNFINAAPNIYLLREDGVYVLLRKKSIAPLFAEEENRNASL